MLVLPFAWNNKNTLNRPHFGSAYSYHLETCEGYCVINLIFHVPFLLQICLSGTVLRSGQLWLCILILRLQFRPVRVAGAG